MRHESAARRILRAEQSAAEFAARQGEGVSKWAYEAGVLRSQVREVCTLLEQFNGALEKPAKGCYFETMCLGDADVLVECEYTPGEPAVWNLDSPMCGPGEAAQVAIVRCLINGRWVDPQDFVDQRILDRWTQQAFDADEDRERARIESARENEREAA